jgi:hypothetical protein
VQNKLSGQKHRIPGALLPFCRKPVSQLDRTELQNLVRRYKKSGPVTPAFIPDDEDPLSGENLFNPLKTEEKV